MEPEQTDSRAMLLTASAQHRSRASAPHSHHSIPNTSTQHEGSDECCVTTKVTLLPWAPRFCLSHPGWNQVSSKSNQGWRGAVSAAQGLPESSPASTPSRLL